MRFDLFFFVWTYSHGYCDCFISTELQLQGFLHKLFWTFFSESLYLWNNHSIMDLSFQFITWKISLNFLSWWQAWWLRNTWYTCFFLWTWGAKGGATSCNHSNLVFLLYSPSLMTHNMYIWLYLYKLALFGGWNMQQKAHPFLLPDNSIWWTNKRLWKSPVQMIETSDGFHLHPRSFTVKAPEKWWLEAKPPFLLGPGAFSGAIPLKLPGSSWTRKTRCVVTFLLWPKKAF